MSKGTPLIENKSSSGKEVKNMNKFTKANNHLIQSIATLKGMDLKKLKNKSEEEIMFEVLKSLESELRENYLNSLLED